MKVCRDLTTFYQKNDKDIVNILSKKFKNVLKYYDLEDLKADIYLRLHKKSYIQNYRPFEIAVDDENRSWYIKPTAAKFSTYLCKFIFNYIYAYHNKINPNSLCLSWEDYNDSNFSEENNSRIKYDDVYSPIDNIDLCLEIERIFSYLKEKTENKGNIVSEDPISNVVFKIIDKEGKDGCANAELINALGFKELKKKEVTAIEEDLLSKAITNIEKKGFITSKYVDNKKRYYLKDIERRSLYNLFSYYMKGYRDKEISEKFNMTVAGIGALKRSLRNEINNCLKE